MYYFLPQNTTHTYSSHLSLSLPQGMVQITWDSPRELEEYISKLQGAAERLTSENRRLRKCHGMLTDKVCVCVCACVCVCVRARVCVCVCVCACHTTPSHLHFPHTITGCAADGSGPAEAAATLEGLTHGNQTCDSFPHPGNPSLFPLSSWYGN